MNLYGSPSIKWGGVSVIADRHIPTWTYHAHEGWRGFLIRRLRIPKRFFKPEKRERVFYKMGDMIMCSHETLEELKLSKFAEDSPSIS